MVVLAYLPHTILPSSNGQLVPTTCPQYNIGYTVVNSALIVARNVDVTQLRLNIVMIIITGR